VTRLGRRAVTRRIRIIVAGEQPHKSQVTSYKLTSHNEVAEFSVSYGTAGREEGRTGRTDERQPQACDRVDRVYAAEIVEGVAAPHEKRISG